MAISLALHDAAQNDWEMYTTGAGGSLQRRDDIFEAVEGALVVAPNDNAAASYDNAAVDAVSLLLQAIKRCAEFGTVARGPSLMDAIMKTRFTGLTGPVTPTIDIPCSFSVGNVYNSFISDVGEMGTDGVLRMKASVNWRGRQSAPSARVFGFGVVTSEYMDTTPVQIGEFLLVVFTVVGKFFVGCEKGFLAGISDARERGILKDGDLMVLKSAKIFNCSDSGKRYSDDWFGDDVMFVVSGRQFPFLVCSLFLTFFFFRNVL